MLVSDVIDRARLALNDQDDANYRWPLDVMLGYLNDAVTAVISRRPDLELNETGTLKTFSALTALDDPISLPDEMTPALADYVSHRAILEDGQDDVNADRAKWHYDAFVRVLTGG